MDDLTNISGLKGFRRPNGGFGIRNVVLILSITGLTGPTARAIGQRVKGTHVISTPYGTGLVGRDREAHMRTLAGLARNPNVASVLLIGDHIPKLKEVYERASFDGQIVESLALDDVGQDHHRMVGRGIEIVTRMVSAATVTERTPGTWADLRIGLKCGRSDPSSGLAANPITGSAIDRIVEAGGSAIFGEVVEWLGAEHLIARRAIDGATRERIISLPREREAIAIAAGLDLMGNNPSPTNIRAGLSTIEEKSLGGISKTGSSPINGVLDYGETPSGTGLYAMDTPNYAPEHLTALSAAGCQLHLFTTGAGNPFVNGLCPTLKISANPETCIRVPAQIDVSIANIIEGSMTEADATARLLSAIADTANGHITKGERSNCGEDVISRFGAAL